jgi:hypothetical protein
MFQHYIDIIRREIQSANKVEEKEAVTPCESASSRLFDLFMAHRSEIAVMASCLLWLQQAKNKAAPLTTTLVVTGYLGYKTVDSLYPAHKPNQKRHLNLEEATQPVKPM